MTLYFPLEFVSDIVSHSLIAAFLVALFPSNTERRILSQMPGSEATFLVESSGIHVTVYNQP